MFNETSIESRHRALTRAVNPEPGPQTILNDWSWSRSQKLLELKPEPEKMVEPKPEPEIWVPVPQP